MRITITGHDGELIPDVDFLQKNPDDDNDFDLWVTIIRQGDSRITLHHLNYEDLHTFATKLMTEVASARP